MMARAPLALVGSYELLAVRQSAVYPFSAKKRIRTSNTLS